MEKNNLPHSFEKRGLDQNCKEAAGEVEDGDEKGNLPHSSEERKLVQESTEAAIEDVDEKHNLPPSSEKRKLEQECTANEDGDLTERSESENASVGERSSKRPKLDLQSDEEQHFYELFQKVRKKIQNLKGVSDEDVKQAIGEIEISFDYNKPQANYSQKKIICGYLFRGATHSAGLARTRILEAVRNCPELKSALGTKDELRVVSIGGGPGSDALGFCSALSELGLDGWTSLSITIVDAAESWSECVSLIVKNLREGEYGSVSKLFKGEKVTMSFVEAKLPGDQKKDINCYDALAKADIIIELRLMQRLSFKRRDRIIETLCKTVKDDALMLPIHEPYYDKFWSKSFSFLYSSETYDYQLSNTKKDFGFQNNLHSQSEIHVLQKKKKSHVEPEKINK